MIILLISRLKAYQYERRDLAAEEMAETSAEERKMVDGIFHRSLPCIYWSKFYKTKTETQGNQAY